MSSVAKITTCAPPLSHAWHSLVSRSIQAWKLRVPEPDGIGSRQEEEILQSCLCLEDFFEKTSTSLMFWFFQRREAFMSQSSLAKWSRDRLDCYVLLLASSGFVSRADCFFVSHFWRGQDRPRPNGKFLRLNQSELSVQEWSYIWIDWTCMPKSPRNSLEEAYFLRALATMSGLIRNCGSAWFYSAFETRL